MRECEHGRVCNAYGDGLGCPAECGYYEPRIDRDALLALAEDVRGYCIERQITPWVAGRIYDRIRKALGVES